jgi:sugar lactone lactonase YvrE
MRMQPFLDLKCRLAESPFWEKKDNVLRFVDMENSFVYRVNLNEGPSSLQKLSYEDPVWYDTTPWVLSALHT